MFNIRPDNLFPWLRIASPPPDDAPGLYVNPDSAEQDLPGFRLPPEDPDRNMPGFHLQPGGSAGSMPDNAASPASVIAAVAARHHALSIRRQQQPFDGRRLVYQCLLADAAGWSPPPTGKAKRRTGHLSILFKQSS